MMGNLNYQMYQNYRRSRQLMKMTSGEGSAKSKCCIKYTLPILDMLSRIPYILRIPILPGFTITIEP